MQVEIKQLDMVTKEITITVDAETASKDYDAFLRKSAKEVQVSGFRKGKAPLAMVERIYGQSIKEYFIKDKIDDYFDQVMWEHKLAYFVTPYVKKAIWSPEEQFETVIEIEHEPELELEIPDPLEVKYEAATLEDTVDRLIRETAQKNYRILDVETAQDLDMVTCELTIQLQDRQIINNATFYAGDSLKQRSLPELVGKNVGDELEIELTGSSLKLVSKENIQDIDNDTGYLCKLMINAISRYSVPEINDDFAKDMDFEDLEEMKQKIAEDIKLGFEHQNMDKENDAIIMSFFENNPFPFPKRAIEYFASQNQDTSGDAQVSAYYKSQMTIQVMQTMLKHFITKALKNKLEPSLAEGDLENFMEHNAINESIPLEAWKEKNKNEINSPDFSDAALNWTMLRSLAQKATFIVPEPQDSEADQVAEENDDNEIQAEES